jgi:hypothetical protein
MCDASEVVHGYRAAQIVEQSPKLTLAQVHAALTDYYDQQDVLDTASKPIIPATAAARLGLLPAAWAPTHPAGHRRAS